MCIQQIYTPHGEPQARADRLDNLLRDERLARRRAEEELERLKSQPPAEPPKKSKGRVNFTARPWLFRYTPQNLEAIDEEDGVLSQPSCGGESKNGGVPAAVAPAGGAAGVIPTAFVIRHAVQSCEA